jgi:hypothetical protein
MLPHAVPIGGSVEGHGADIDRKLRVLPSQMRERILVAPDEPVIFFAWCSYSKVRLEVAVL